MEIAKNPSVRSPIRTDVGLVTEQGFLNGADRWTGDSKVDDGSPLTHLVSAL
jgi:hypothetical protein